jgi:hypothetical protein
MDEIFALVLSWAVTLGLIFAVLRRDERRLTAEQLGRAWPPSTRLMAPVYFGVFCLPVHFWKTRRSLGGLLVGLAWGVAITALDEAIDWGVDRLAWFR